MKTETFLIRLFVVIYAIACFSMIFMEINSKGQVISSDIQKTVINITRRMSYTNINKLLNNLDEKVDEIIEFSELKDFIDNPVRVI